MLKRVTTDFYCRIKMQKGGKMQKEKNNFLHQFYNTVSKSALRKKIPIYLPTLFEFCL